jgi:cytochrome d ubiquinol oxidase subunit II
MDPWNLETLWFALIAVLWIGYFFLEGFDFGVGNLLPFLGREDGERRQMIHTIGPFWDGNEVWLLTAGGATFAAFPEWYATLFSGFYLALFLILFALILRGAAFEFRGKVESARWRNFWDWSIFVGSVLPSILWGVAFANIVRGVPINSDSEFTGSLLTLLNPYGLLGGLVTLSLFTLSGAFFLQLRTVGDVRERAKAVARTVAPVATLVAAGFLVWTMAISTDLDWWTVAIMAVAALCSIGALYLAWTGTRPAYAFALNGLAIATAVVSLFTDLWPNVMPSSTDEAFSLTVFNASSTTYTLTVMTIVALIMTPIVLLYQAWSYYAFRRRVGLDGAEESPQSVVDLLPGHSKQ